jgi:hypothetical protein
MRVLNHNHKDIKSHPLCCWHVRTVWISVLSLCRSNRSASELWRHPAKLDWSCLGNSERVLPQAPTVAGYSGPAKSVVFFISRTSSVVVLVEVQCGERNRRGLDC